MLIRIAYYLGKNILRSQVVCKYNIARQSHRISSFFQNYKNIQSQTRNLSNELEEEEEQEVINNNQQLVNKYFKFSQDDMMTKIQNFENIEQVQECIEKNLDLLERKHIIQLLLLSGILRIKNELTVIKNRDEFVKKIDTLLINDEIELSVILLHLRLLGVKRNDATMQKIIDKLLNIFKEKGNECELISLSLFSEFLLLEKDLYSKLIMVEIMKLIDSKFEQCNDPLEFYNIISCLNNIHTVLSFDAMTKYKAKIEEFLEKNMIDDTKTIFKIINFLNFPHWSSYNTKLIQRLLNILLKSVPNMESKELFQTKRSFLVQHEPANLILALRDRAHKLLEKNNDVELLQIVCMYCTPDNRQKYVEMFRDKILKFQTSLGPSTDSLSTFFKILRLLRVSDLELCDCFWTKIVNKIFSLPEPELRYRLPKYFQRYMYFNNNLGGTYRHKEFEAIVYEYCIEELKTNSLYLPRDFAKFASFVIAYGDKYKMIPPFIIEKLIMIQDQLNSLDCKLLARGLEISYGFRVRKKENSVTFDNQVEIIQFILDNCAQRHLQDPNVTINEVNTILSSYIRRRAARDSQIFYEIMNWYDGKTFELNSRIIREICHSLSTSKFCIDSLFDQFFDYVVKNKKIITGETVEKILTTCFNLSYFPDNMEALDCCNAIIHRDFDIMSGLSIVQALLALTFYKAAPQELVSLVFNGDFIKRLEQEVQMSYSKDTYPRKVMTLVMQLNRAICLDHPEYNIRWFQQNFIEAQMSKKPVIVSKFHDEVQRLLLQIVPNQDFLATNRVTPYGYRIDFEIHLDKNYNKFMKINSEDYIGVNFKPKVNKIAILLLGFDTFCINDVNRLRGAELLRMRHLEMMNYKVIHVKKSDFRMLYENVTAKINHLKKLLQLSA